MCNKSPSYVYVNQNDMYLFMVSIRKPFLVSVYVCISFGFSMSTLNPFASTINKYIICIDMICPQLGCIHPFIPASIVPMHNKDMHMSQCMYVHAHACTQASLDLQTPKHCFLRAHLLLQDSKEDVHVIALTTSR